MMNDAIFSKELSDVAKVAAGYPLRGSVEALLRGEVAFVQLKNVDPHLGVDWSTVTKVALPSGREPRWLTSGDIVFAARGARNFAYLIEDGPGSCVCSPHFFVLSVRDVGALLPEFLVWQINQKPAQEYLRKNSVGTQTIVTIRRPALESLPVIVPSLREQQLIVKLSRAARAERAALSLLIENNEKLSSSIAYGLHDKAQETK